MMATITSIVLAIILMLSLYKVVMATLFNRAADAVDLTIAANSSLAFVILQMLQILWTK